MCRHEVSDNEKREVQMTHMVAFHKADLSAHEELRDEQTSEDLKTSNLPPLVENRLAINNVTSLPRTAELLTMSPNTMTDAQSTQSSRWQTMLDDAKHFTGGLVSHPCESTKHYSILRHSHGLVYYKGHYTSLAITVFSDLRMPDDRSFWLQRKGWSGNTGLKAGALLGTKGAWVNVTPETAAPVEHLPRQDERAWQRDIAQFLRKAPPQIHSHRPRETAILRIPAQVDDGYFRVVLCSGERGKKVLCPSPLFRLASLSTSSSSLRGASLSTLPLELAVKIGSSVARKAVASATANALAPVQQSVKTAISPYQPGFVAREAVVTAYNACDLSHDINYLDKRAEQKRELFGQQADQDCVGYHELERSEVVGADAGPGEPFPLRFTGKVVLGSGKSQRILGMPTSNLANVPDDILLRSSGVYCGWAYVHYTKDLQDVSLHFEQWHQAIITIAPTPSVQAQVHRPNRVNVYLIYDFQGTRFIDSKLSVILMGYLRPHVEFSGSDPEAALFDMYKDIVITQASLNRPAWTAESTLQRMKVASSSRTIKDRYVDLQASTRKQVERVPLHKIGVRTKGMALNDEVVGTGGIFVRR